MEKSPIVSVPAGHGVASPRRDARIAGALYLVIIVCGAFAAAFVRQRLRVPGDPTATVANILEHERLYRLGFVADLVPLLCNMILAVLFYHLGMTLGPGPTPERGVMLTHSGTTWSTVRSAAGWAARI